MVHSVDAKKKDTGTTEVGEGEGILGNVDEDYRQNDF